MIFSSAASPLSTTVGFQPTERAVNIRFSRAISLSSAIRMSSLARSGGAYCARASQAKGIVNQNSLPQPGALITPISPPMVLTK